MNKNSDLWPLYNTEYAEVEQTLKTLQVTEQTRTTEYIIMLFTRGILIQRVIVLLFDTSLECT